MKRIALGTALLITACSSSPQIAPTPERSAAEVERQISLVQQAKHREKLRAERREARRRRLVYVDPNPEATKEAAKKFDGAQVFASQMCGSCHATDGQTSSLGPNLAHRWGQRVTLASGEQVTFDEHYVRESIAAPTAKLHQGFPPVMPEFGAKLSPSEIEALAQYVRKLSS
jgi:mono/diheme cytochrome c family protein